MVGKISEIDKRRTPRIKAEPPLKLSGDINAQLLNINDGGICFSVTKPLTVKKCALVIDFPSQPVKIHVDIKWSRKSNDGRNFLYGASFINPDSAILTIVRKYMISKQFKFVVKDIKDKTIRKHVLKFAKQFRDYLFGLVDLSIAISSKKIRKKDIHERLKLITDDIVKKADMLRQNIDNKIVTRKIKHEFRSLVSCWAFKSQIVKRGFDKPRGYPGDFDTLEVIYDKKIFSSDADLGYYFDVYFLENPYAEAVRNRKDTFREMLRKILISRKGELKILNLACGSCREIWELYKTYKDVCETNAEFTLLDWDDHALDFSKNRLKGIPKNARFKFIKEDIMQFVRSSVFFDKNGRQDLVYSIGLADYLPDRVLKKLIKNSFEGLNNKGKFIIAHKDKNNVFSHLPPEWFCDWEFCERDEKDLVSLIDSIQLDYNTIDITREKSGNIFFVTVNKK